MTYQEKADALFEDQKTTWPLLGSNWEKLGAAQLKTFTFDGYTIRVQFNPRRIVSTAAKVDKVSIENRNCFLCRDNRPAEEKEVYFGNEYEILCNPFPIFTEHFTIAKTEHVPQVIQEEFGGFLELSKELPDLVVFYNAPNCGASAPDHMHYQAGSRGFMPIEDQITTLVEKYGKSLTAGPDLAVTAVDDGLRRFVVLESGQSGLLEEVFFRVYEFMQAVHHGVEPMINMLSYYQDQWQILIFPREKHRPWQFFEEGEKNILLSPAAVDMGGTLITPLEKDFNKITHEDIIDIFSQICLSASTFDLLLDHLSKNAT
ncbi:MAG: DUF4922 domain-containing protein [Bacteroidales bacterium]|nr:DUF4922 domain-containing protein [Bacteroidales bacterium]